MPLFTPLVALLRNDSKNLDQGQAKEIFEAADSKFIASETDGIAGAVRITNRVAMTQAAYDALPVKSATTEYVIIEP